MNPSAYSSSSYRSPLSYSGWWSRGSPPWTACITAGIPCASLSPPLKGTGGCGGDSGSCSGREGTVVAAKKRRDDLNTADAIAALF